MEEKFVPLETISPTLHGYLTTMFTGNYTINSFINQAYISSDVKKYLPEP
jgi:hypothetical protein